MKELPILYGTPMVQANLADHKGIDTRKVFAHVYIDDRALLTLPPWTEIYKIITEKATHEIMKKYA